MKLRVGVNALFLRPGEVGGSQTYVSNTLLAMPPKAAQWVVFTNAENHTWFADLVRDRNDVELRPLRVRARRRWARILREQWVLPLRARRARIDVLWSPGYTAPIACPVPSVPSVLDAQYRRFPEDLSFLERLVLDVLLRAAGRTARCWLTLSEFSRNELVEAFGWPRDRIRVTPLAPGPAFRSGSSHAKDLERLRDLGVRPPYLLCVAHTHPHKNVAALIEAHARVAHELPHALVLVGRPRRGEPACRRALSAHPDRSRVLRLEAVPEPDLVALYQRAEWFVFPSRYEGFGLPVLEAMACGTPVLTTRCAAIPEVAGPAAVYVDPPTAETLADALRCVSRMSPQERFEWAARAQARAREFSWERTAALTLEALETAASGGGRG